ncbi:MAG: cupin domain-containing protein [Dehalococcoidia bacterium]|nr:cupin domain-containing protein [Dehalococcoidia bacterium]
MERTEPYATPEDFKRRISHVGRGADVDLGSHGSANILCGERIMLSYVDMPANSYADPHRHKDIEQITILLKGDAEFVVEGKRFAVKEGDVLIFAPDEEHGAYMGPNGARVLDVFTPPREDLREKMQ